MAARVWIDRVSRTARGFCADDGGNVLIIFTLAILPILAALGVAVDYSRANSTRTAIQAALDSTALMLSKEAPTLTQDQLNQKAGDYFAALFNRPEAKNIVLTPTLTTPQEGSFQLDLKATGTIDTVFLRSLDYYAAGLGQKAVSYGTSSRVMWGIKKLEVALALDNTGSMAWSNKMTNLKTAAKNLLTTLQTAAKKDGDVKVAIIPFDTTVNIGSTHATYDWFDYDQIDCNGSNWGTGCNDSNWMNHWEGCVRDRTQPYDTQDDAPNPSITSTLFPAHNCGSLVKAMPLTYDWTALKAKIDSMQSSGNTNVTIGLVWGWHALTSGAPWSEASVPKPDLDKVIILLTDGQNTQAWKNSNNTSITSSSTIDARTAAVCANVKAASIKLYTIRVIDGNATLLKNCATNPTMYYDVQQASELNVVFSAIAQNLANLRIAK
jgi:Mg-chelatase subunit ChlD